MHYHPDIIIQVSKTMRFLKNKLIIDSFIEKWYSNRCRF